MFVVQVIVAPELVTFDTVTPLITGSDAAGEPLVVRV
jgi:hypothetical protein